MTIPEAAIILILSFWLIASILYAFFNRQLATYTNRFDPFRWISAYQLFSDTARSFRLFYRDKLTDNNTSEWKNIPLMAPSKWHHAFWFPEALVMKNMQSIIDDLIRFVESRQNTTPLKKVSDRFIYQTILRFVHRFPAGKNSVERQFKIEESRGGEGNHTIHEVFISDFHKG